MCPAASAESNWIRIRPVSGFAFTRHVVDSRLRATSTAAARRGRDSNAGTRHRCRPGTLDTRTISAAREAEQYIQPFNSLEWRFQPQGATATDRLVSRDRSTGIVAVQLRCGLGGAFPGALRPWL